jgi:hypothetical protein
MRRLISDRAPSLLRAFADQQSLIMTGHQGPRVLERKLSKDRLALAITSRRLSHESASIRAKLATQIDHSPQLAFKKCQTNAGQRPPAMLGL